MKKELKKGENAVNNAIECDEIEQTRRFLRDVDVWEFEQEMRRRGYFFYKDDIGAQEQELITNLDDEEKKFFAENDI